MQSWTKHLNPLAVVSSLIPGFRANPFRGWPVGAVPAWAALVFLTANMTLILLPTAKANPSQQAAIEQWRAMSARAMGFWQRQVSATLSTHQKVFLEQVLLPVIADRYPHTRVDADGENKLVIQVILNPRAERSPVVARYTILFSPNHPVVPPVIPDIRIHQSESGLESQSQLELAPSIALTPEQRQRLQGRVRSMVRADGVLHPHIIPPTPGAQLRLSTPQARAVRALKQLATSRLLTRFQDLLPVGTSPENHPVRVGLVMPTGSGKSEVLARFLDKPIAEDSPHWDFLNARLQTRPPLTLVLADTVDAVDNLVERLAHRNNIPREHIARLYGAGSGSRSLLPATAGGDREQPRLSHQLRLVGLTRSGMIHRLSELDASFFRLFSHVRVVIDEAHHVGLEGGQYQTLLNHLDRALRSTDMIVFASATFWHGSSRDLPLITGGANHVAFLSPGEKQEFNRGSRVTYLTQMAYFNAVEQGYISPLYSYQLVEHLPDSRPVRELTSRRFFATPTVAPRNESERRDLQTEIQEQSALVNAMADAIRQMRIPITSYLAGARQAYVPDRILMVVPTRKHANLYAEMLARRFLELRDGTGVRAYHSGEGLDPENLDWFRDELARSEHMAQRERMQHKILIVVDRANEAIDIPGINGVVIVRNMESERRVMQVVGRGTRVSPFKPDLRVLDFGGSLAAFTEAIPPGTMTSVFVGQQRQGGASREWGLVLGEPGGAQLVTAWLAQEELSAPDPEASFYPRLSGDPQRLTAPTAPPTPQTPARVMTGHDAEVPISNRGFARGADPSARRELERRLGRNMFLGQHLPDTERNREVLNGQNRPDNIALLRGLAFLVQHPELNTFGKMRPLSRDNVSRQRLNRALESLAEAGRRVDLISSPGTLRMLALIQELETDALKEFLTTDTVTSEVYMGILENRLRTENPYLVSRFWDRLVLETSVERPVYFLRDLLSSLPIQSPGLEALVVLASAMESHNRALLNSETVGMLVGTLLTQVEIRLFLERRRGSDQFAEVQGLKTFTNDLQRALWIRLTQALRRHGALASSDFPQMNGSAGPVPLASFKILHLDVRVANFVLTDLPYHFPDNRSVVEKLVTIERAVLTTLLHVSGRQRLHNLGRGSERLLTDSVRSAVDEALRLVNTPGHPLGAISNDLRLRDLDDTSTRSALEKAILEPDSQEGQRLAPVIQEIYRQVMARAEQRILQSAQDNIFLRESFLAASPAGPSPRCQSLFR